MPWGGGVALLGEESSPGRPVRKEAKWLFSSLGASNSAYCAPTMHWVFYQVVGKHQLTREGKSLSLGTSIMAGWVMGDK